MRRPLRRSRSFKVTDFGTNGKLIYDFLLVINTNLHRLQVMADYDHIFASESGVPANIAINDISLKLDSLGYIYGAESIGVSSTTFTQSVPKATEFGEIKLRLVLLRRSRSSKVTEFGIS